MDDNTRQVLVALISALGGFASGVFVAKIGFDHARDLDRQRSQGEAERDRKRRVRDWRLQALAETREVLAGQLDFLIKFVLTGDLEAKSPIQTQTRYNINLVGDPEVIREWTGVVAELSARMPATRREALARVVRGQTLAEIDTEMMLRATAASATLLKALDDQERRILEDQPLRECPGRPRSRTGCEKRSRSSSGFIDKVVDIGPAGTPVEPLVGDCSARRSPEGCSRRRCRPEPCPRCGRRG